MKRIRLFCFIFLLFSGKIFGQFSDVNDYIARIWTFTDGLPGNTVSDILQTSDGYIYFATYEGLVKFDGYDFTVLNKYSESNDGKKYNFISTRSLYEDSNKNIWVGSNDEGVQKLCADGSSFVYDVSNGLPNNSVRCIVEDKHQNIWIGTASGVVYITPFGEIVNPASDGELNVSKVLVHKLYCDSAGRIWLLTVENKGIFIYSNSVFSRYDKFDELGDYVPSALGQDNSGNLWFGLSQKGIFKVGNGVFAHVETNTKLDSIITWNIYADKSGAIWFSTEKGLVLFRDGEFSEYSEDNMMSSAFIGSILEDREGNIWVGSDKSGVGKISPGKFRMNNLHNPVNSICEDKDGLVWIGTDNGVLCLKNGCYIENEITKCTNGVRVRHIGFTKNGDLLVNCYDEPAMLRYSKSGLKSWTYSDGLIGNKTRVSIELDNGDIYCGTTNGLSVITAGGRIDNFTSDNGLECEYVMWLYQDKNGFIWIGTDGGGIFIMKNGVILRKITTANGLAGNVIFKISQDNNGDFWICTGAGISFLTVDYENFLDDNVDLAIVNINSQNGIGSDSIFQILHDKFDNIWMVSNRGISCVPLSNVKDVVYNRKKVLDVQFFNQNDGLKSNGANSTALSMIDNDGRIWFTMTDGFAVYDPYRSHSQKALPIVQIVNVQVDDEVYYDFDEPIIIPPDTKHIEIQYTGLSFTSSERNRFIYKMEGFDDDFSELTDRRSVNYTNLRPGKYTFWVDVQNGDGDFSDERKFVEFIQEAHIYQLPIFWLSIALFVIITIIVVFAVKISISKKRQLMLETQIQMATVELQMAKDDSDRLLKNILPVSIAERLKGVRGNKTIADTYDDVTVLFSDIVGFTKATSTSTAEDIVSSLNDLISRFDKRAVSMGVEKIKTIGDAYMAACGVPEKNKNHAVIMLKFAVGMYKDLSEYNKTAKIKFNLRIGLNTGKVIAGVIGKNKFIYDIWGDTVNVASRMESNCNPGHIRMTESVKKNLDEHHIKFKYKEIMCDVKGKGIMKTIEFPEK